MVAWVATGRSNDEIAEALVVSPATVRTHVSRAMLKLDARDRAQLVVFAPSSPACAPTRRSGAVGRVRLAGRPAVAAPAGGVRLINQHDVAAPSARCGSTDAAVAAPDGGVRLIGRPAVAAPSAGEMMER